ncbi:MAG: response regulator [Deltaproteobacteria bacterium]|jgi:putative two-component system response regulator|nr:response regulator [Deltaproteobacteria bacterium]
MIFDKSARAPKKKILVVDDNVTNLMFAKTVLSAQYDVFTAPSAAKMFLLLKAAPISLILLDISMPEMSGIEAIKILKKDPEFRRVPVIFLTALVNPDSEVDGLSLGAVDYIAKPIEPKLLLKRVEIHLTMEEQRVVLERQKKDLENFNLNLRELVEEKTHRVLELQKAILSTVAGLVESRDDITGGHVERTCKWLERLVEGLLESGEYRDLLENWDLPLLVRSSELHDVGKISISDSILLKKGLLTSDEFELIKWHTTFGVRIIDRIASGTSEKEYLAHARIFAGTHHEKWDGTGYPEGLRGKEIPLQGRLLAIADVYDALTSDRPYKKAFSHQAAVGIILEGRGKHFDPFLVDIFEKVSPRFERYLN